MQKLPILIEKVNENYRLLLKRLYGCTVLNNHGFEVTITLDNVCRVTLEFHKSLLRSFWNDPLISGGRKKNLFLVAKAWGRT